MSALDFGARALALQAHAGRPLLFAECEGRALPPRLERIETSGHSVRGAGAGTYVHDDLCDAALAADHPAFTFTAADGRVFRLLATDNAICVEQGGAVGQAGTNDQPAIQATIDFAEAVGAAEVRFGQTHYELWAPTRTSPMRSNLALDGHFIRITRSLTLRGSAARRTTLDCRGQGGADPETNWQIVPFSSTDSKDAVWRGNACFVRGTTNQEKLAQGGRLDVEHVALHRLVFLGNTRRTGQHTWPADPVTGDGWDGTHQGFKVHDTQVGDIELVDTDFIGWKGEILYLAGYDPSSLTMARVKLLGTNGNAMNPGVNCPVIATDCEFGDAYQAHEETGKRFARYTGCIWRDADKLNIGSGPTDGLQHTYLYPTRSESTQPPVTQFDGCEFRNVTTAYVGNWVRGNLRTTDTTVNLSANLWVWMQDVDLSIDAVLDQKTLIHPVIVSGPANATTQANGAPVGTYVQPPRNLHLRVRHTRTRLAQREGRHWSSVRWSGVIDPSCRIVVDGAEGTSAPAASTIPAAAMPYVEVRNFAHTQAYIAHGAVNVGPVNANGELKVASPIQQAHSGVDGTFDMTLPAAPTAGSAYGFAEGQKLRLYKNGTTGDLRFVKNANAATHVVETRVLRQDGDWIEFTYDSSARRWAESGFFSVQPLVRKGSWAGQAIPVVPAGSTAELSLALPGAKTGEVVSLGFEPPLAGVFAFGQVTAPDTLGVTLLNPAPTDSVALSAKVTARVEPMP